MRAGMHVEPDSQPSSPPLEPFVPPPPSLGRFTVRWGTVVWVSFVGTLVLLAGTCVAWSVHEVSAY